MTSTESDSMEIKSSALSKLFEVESNHGHVTLAFLVQQFREWNVQDQLNS